MSKKLGFLLPSQQRDASGHVLTHGFVHGHVHQHLDHVHIHGHIHNHDHGEQALAAAAGGGPRDRQQHGTVLPELECKELEKSFDLCDDIFCDELDDCYYYACDGAGIENAAGPGVRPTECCSDESCEAEPVAEMGVDSGCGDTGHHDNSLCEWQRPRLTIFEDLIQNVHRNLEPPGGEVPFQVGEMEKMERIGGMERIGEMEKTAKMAKMEKMAKIKKMGNPADLAGEPCKAGGASSAAGLSLIAPETSLIAPETPLIAPETPLIAPETSLIAPEMSLNPPLLSLHPPVLASHAAPAKTHDAPRPPSETKQALDGLQFHIHFPHHCHQDPPRNPGEGAPAGPGFHLHAEGDHSMHQSCFHARLPLPSHPGQPGPAYGQQQAQLQQDYDFFVQFNNFQQLFAEPGLKMADLELPAGLKGAPHVDAVRPPHTFLCQWENCLQPVDNESLMDHLLGTHLAQELLGPGAPPPGKLECEWDDCGFMDGDVRLFLDHLSSHKADAAMAAAALPLLTPSSMALLPQAKAEAGSLGGPAGDGHACFRTQRDVGPLHGTARHSCVGPPHGNVAPTDSHAPDSHGTVSHGTDTHGPDTHTLRILDMRISPKRAVACEPPDPLHTCKWQTGTSAAGEPIVCNRTHASAGELQDHLKDAHIGRGKLIYHCCWHGCERNHGKPFTQRQKIFRHIHVHTGHRPCVCATCGASFAVPSLLKLHQRIHLGEKPYACATCGRCFATRSSRAIHMRIHSDSRPLVCTWPGCGKRFRESTNLTKHMRTHTRTFTCEHCGKDFDTRRGLTRHMKSHDAVADAGSQSAMLAA